MLLPSLKLHNTVIKLMSTGNYILKTYFNIILLSIPILSNGLSVSGFRN